MSEDAKKEKVAPAEDKKSAAASDQVNDLQPLIAGFKAKLLAGKAKVNTLIAEKAPVVKDAVVKSLDKWAEQASESRAGDAEAVATAEAEAAALKEKAVAQKAAAPAAKVEEKAPAESAKVEPAQDDAKDDAKEEAETEKAQ